MGECAPHLSKFETLSGVWLEVEKWKNKLASTIMLRPNSIQCDAIKRKTTTKVVKRSSFVIEKSPFWSNNLNTSRTKEPLKSLKPCLKNDAFSNFRSGVPFQVFCGKKAARGPPTQSIWMRTASSAPPTYLLGTLWSCTDLTYFLKESSYKKPNVF